MTALKRPKAKSSEGIHRDIYFDKPDLVDQLLELAEEYSERTGRPVSLSEIVRIICSQQLRVVDTKIKAIGPIRLPEIEAVGLKAERKRRRLNIAYDAIRDGETVNLSVGYFFKKPGQKMTKTTEIIKVKRTGNRLKVIAR